MLPLLLASHALVALRCTAPTTGDICRSRPVQLAVPSSLGRKAVLSLTLSTALAAFSRPSAASAYNLRDAQFSYSIAYPDDWKDGSKPVRTHEHERLLASPTGGGVKLGITVDPVKIESLEAFGSLDQTTERVLGVERGRDGVKEVTLRNNAAVLEDGQPTYYTINYVTESSRGTKIFLCKYCIANRRLYVLQAQANVATFDSDEAVRSTLESLVGSFKVLV